MKHTDNLCYEYVNFIVAPIEHSIKMSIYKQLYDYYIAPENWYMAIQVSEEVSLQEAQNNIVQICLYLEGLGIIAKNLDDASQFLLKTLYLIIERAGKFKFLKKHLILNMSYAVNFFIYHRQ